MTRLRTPSAWMTASVLSLAVLIFLVIWPLLTLFYKSAVDPATGQLRLEGFRTFFEEPEYVQAFVNTIRLGFTSTIGTLLLGAPLAYVVARYDFPGKSVVAMLPLATIVLPDIVVSQAWLMLLGNNGIIRLALESIGIYLPSFYGWFCMSYTLILNDYTDRKSTRLNSSHVAMSYAIFCL